ncbi:MAG: type II toxin-antitoxin system RelE/ParE family toxin [Chloroflexota bacterium]
MNRRLEWDRQARADLITLSRRDPRTADRIRMAMRRFTDENIGDVQKLSAWPGVYRLRVGDWRILFSIEDEGLVVLALRVLNRRDAYR